MYNIPEPHSVCRTMQSNTGRHRQPLTRNRLLHFLDSGFLHRLQRLGLLPFFLNLELGLFLLLQCLHLELLLVGLCPRLQALLHCLLFLLLPELRGLFLQCHCLVLFLVPARLELLLFEPLPLCFLVFQSFDANLLLPRLFAARGLVFFHVLVLLCFILFILRRERLLFASRKILPSHCCLRTWSVVVLVQEQQKRSQWLSWAIWIAFPPLCPARVHVLLQSLVKRSLGL
mmetsp:Transcript_33720/g.45906  ORF Transcript_33720/g.45906 Transcript_33720/m.45906 type:complete len:230 (+) Transcript_33720:267-956(+)